MEFYFLRKHKSYSIWIAVIDILNHTATGKSGTIVVKSNVYEKKNF